MGLSRFAGLWVRDGAVAETLTTVPVVLDLWTNDSDGVNGIDASIVDGKIRFEVPGYYAAYASLSFTVGAGEIIYAEFRVNGLVGSGFRAQAEGIASGGPVNMFLMGAANMKAGDILQVYVYSDQGGGSTFTLVDGQFGVLSQ